MATETAGVDAAARAARIVKARERFNRARSHKIKAALSFDNLLQRFECESQAAIAKSVGLTRERIRQIYNEFFKELFEDRSGMMNLRIRKLERTRGPVSDAENVYLSAIIQRANMLGYPVQRVYSSNGFCRSKVLSIYGILCGIRVVKSSHMIHEHPYISFSFTNSSFRDVSLMLCLYVASLPENDRIFIFPADVLQTWLFHKKNCYQNAVVLPLERKNNHRDDALSFPEIYENAWFMLDLVHKLNTE